MRVLFVQPVGSSLDADRLLELCNAAKHSFGFKVLDDLLIVWSGPSERHLGCVNPDDDELMGKVGEFLLTSVVTVSHSEAEIPAGET